MSKPISRRAFLQTGLTAAAVAVAVPADRAAAAGTQDHLATLIDISRCIGCGACVEACRETNAAKFPRPHKPFPKMYPERVKVSDWSEKQNVDDRLTPYNWLFIQEVSVESNGETVDLTIPRRCMHCVNPPCVKLCPWGASRQYANGISRIDTDMCLGGSKCKDVCPWDVPQRQTGDGLYLKLLPSLAGNGIMNKCDRCYDRVAKGASPACIAACPEEVQTIGPRDKIIARARALAQETGGHIYGIDENGGTNTIYVSPVPFEAINQTLATGPGRPHLNPVADRMAEANNIGWAMLVAPLAGAAAAAGRIWKAGRRTAEAIGTSDSQTNSKTTRR